MIEPIPPPKVDGTTYMAGERAMRDALRAPEREERVALAKISLERCEGAHEAHTAKAKEMENGG